MTAWHYRYEAKGIQAWMLATDSLKEIAGGSALVEDLERAADVHARECGGRVLQAAAGAATLRFENRDALESFAATWPRQAARITPGLQVIQAWSLTLDELPAALGDARNRTPIDLPEAGPWIARAGRTGRPATGRQEGMLVDAATRAKLKASKDTLRDIVDRLYEDTETRPKFLTDLNRYPDGAIALVHADGDGIGRRIAAMAPEALEPFSKALSQVTTRAVREAIDHLERCFQVYEDNAGHVPLPVRPIVVGGDDVTVMLSARHSIAFADFLVRAFARLAAAEAALRDAQGKGPTLTAGVAIVRNGYPFARAHEIAEEACRAAKPSNGAGGRLAFRRLTTSLEATEDGADAESTTAHTRGYTPDQLKHLQAAAQATTSLPKGKLRTWLGVAQGAARRGESQDRAQALWTRTLEYLERPEHREGGPRRAFVGFCAALHAIDPSFPSDGRLHPEAIGDVVGDALTWARVTGNEPELWGR